MVDKKLSSDLLRGHTDTIILKLLTYGDKSDYFEILVIEGENVLILGCNVLKTFEMIQVAPVISQSGTLTVEIIPKRHFLWKGGGRSIIYKFIKSILTNKIRWQFKDLGKQNLIIERAYGISWHREVH